ncbi:hypothetical protein BC834DRAFT_967188 [Gloeopeniophorella convolvens]|nr:hypothetical protein BC834DRAFT_967188 [Gloeopeniophorella convolvens]
MVLSGAEYEDLYGGPSSSSHHAPVVAMPPSNPVPVANPQDDAMPIPDPATFMIADSDPDPPTVGSLLGRLAEPPIPGLQAHMTTAPPMTSAVPILRQLVPMSPFIQIAKIYCLLPCFWYGAGNELLFTDGSAPENDDGTIDISHFSHAVLIMPRTGEPDERGARCTTTLVPMERIVGGNSHINRALRLPLALGALPPGGKDGVLIAPNDPSTSAEVDKLFQRAHHDSAARARLRNYVEHVQFTPPEIRQDPHRDVPARWQTFEYSNETELAPPNELGPRVPTKAGKAVVPLSEPSHKAEVSQWKAWLKISHLNSERRTKKGVPLWVFYGIPRHNNGYQTLHIETWCELRGMIPKDPKAVPKLKGPFAQLTAILLCVPGWYGEFLTAHGITIAPLGTRTEYTVEVFGDPQDLTMTQLKMPGRYDPPPLPDPTPAPPVDASTFSPTDENTVALDDDEPFPGIEDEAGPAGM